MSEPTNHPDEPEVIARLLRLAGPRPEAAVEVRERVHDAVRARWLEKVKARRRRVGLTWLVAAAAAAAGIALMVEVGNRGSGVAPPIHEIPAAALVFSIGSVQDAGGAAIQAGAEIQPGTVVKTGDDARAALRLANGAAVRLDVGTRVTVVSGAALDLAQGRVYVDTRLTTDPLRRIEIRTEFGVLRDIGTRFEVRVQDAELRVRVRQGIVRLDRKAGSHDVQSGAQLNVKPGGGLAWGNVTPYGEEWSWILEAAPAFELEGRVLSEFLDWISSETGLSVTFTDQSIEREAHRIVLHGSVAGVRPDQAPGVVLPTCGLGHRVVGDTLIVGPAVAGGGGG
ncbi:MAG TPA: FecR family protein [Candidatus Polarisedimenticolia bacterium]|jgi:ferric-dicitrate binding protein FerR (iron transport regulator)